MKKAFISVALATALFFGASAQAVPGWYSYQGVATEYKNQTVDVTFYITDLADSQEPLYVEVHHGVKTNAAGAFSCQLGLGEQDANQPGQYANIEEIDWAAGPYAVKTFINHYPVGTAQLGAVPYATIAGKALGVAGVEDVAEEIKALWAKNEDQDEASTMIINLVSANTEAIETLTQYAEGFDEQLTNVATLATGAANIATTNEEAIAELKDQMVYATEQVDNALEGLTGLNNQVNDLASEVEANTEAIAATSEALPELIQQVHQNTTGLSLLEAKVNGLEVGEGADLTEVTARIDALETEVATNIDAINNAEQTLVEIVPAVAGNTGAIAALRADVDTNIDAIANAEQTLVEIVPAVAGNTGAIAALRADVDLNIEGLAEAEKSISEISEAMPGITASINKLNQEMEGAYEQMEQIATLATGASQIAMANEEAIDQLKDQMVYAVEQADNANLAITQLNNVVNDLAAEMATTNDGLNETQSTIIELTEQVRSNAAGVVDVETTTNAHYLELKALIQTQGEAIADLQQQILGLR